MTFSKFSWLFSDWPFWEMERFREDLWSSIAEIPIAGITERSPARKDLSSDHARLHGRIICLINICPPLSFFAPIINRGDIIAPTWWYLSPSTRNTIAEVFSLAVVLWKKKKLVFISQDEKLHRCRTRIIHRESESERLWSYFSVFLHKCWLVLSRLFQQRLLFLASLLRRWWMVKKMKT